MIGFARHGPVFSSCGEPASGRWRISGPALAGGSDVTFAGGLYPAPLDGGDTGHAAARAAGAPAKTVIVAITTTMQHAPLLITSRSVSGMSSGSELSPTFNR